LVGVAAEEHDAAGRVAHADACEAGQQRWRARRAAAAARHGHPLPKDCRRAHASMSDALPGVSRMKQIPNLLKLPCFLSWSLCPGFQVLLHLSLLNL
jgi:hypothetical protein